MHTLKHPLVGCFSLLHRLHVYFIFVYKNSFQISSFLLGFVTSIVFLSVPDKLKFICRSKWNKILAKFAFKILLFCACANAWLIDFSNLNNNQLSCFDGFRTIVRIFIQILLLARNFLKEPKFRSENAWFLLCLFKDQIFELTTTMMMMILLSFFSLF